jgi:hypothetical protein
VYIFLPYPIVFIFAVGHIFTYHYFLLKMTIAITFALLFMLQTAVSNSNNQAHSNFTNLTIIHKSRIKVNYAAARKLKVSLTGSMQELQEKQFDVIIVRSSSY